MSRLGALGLALAVLTLAPAGAAPIAADEDEDKIVCRKEVPIGGVVSRQITCRSKASWKRPITHQKDEDRDFREETLIFPKDGARLQAIQTGSAKWDKLPAAQAKRRYLPYSQLVHEVEEILRTKKCAMPGQSPRAFDIEVPFALLIEPNGRASRIVVPELDCDPIEALAGLTALAQSDRGDFQPTGEAKARWYAGRINFTLS